MKNKKMLNRKKSSQKWQKKNLKRSESELNQMK